MVLPGKQVTLPPNLGFSSPDPTITHVSRSQAKCQPRKAGKDGFYSFPHPRILSRDGCFILHPRAKLQLVVITPNLWKICVLGPPLDKTGLYSSFLLRISLPFGGFMSLSQDETWGAGLQLKPFLMPCPAGRLLEPHQASSSHVTCPPQSLAT